VYRLVPYNRRDLSKGGRLQALQVSINGQPVVFNERITTNAVGQTQVLFLDESAMEPSCDGESVESVVASLRSSPTRVDLSWSAPGSGSVSGSDSATGSGTVSGSGGSASGSGSVNSNDKGSVNTDTGTQSPSASPRGDDDKADNGRQKMKDQ